MFNVKKYLFYAVFFLLSLSLVMAPGQQDVATSGSVDAGGAPEDVGTGNDATNGSGSQQQVEAVTALQNAGENTQNKVMTQTKTEAKSGEYTSEGGQKIQLQTKEGDKVELKSGNSVANTAMKMTQEQTATGTKLQVELSNGKNAEVKIMPDTASQKAMEQLQLKVCTAEEGCTLELKEVGKGEEAQPAYEIQGEAEGKFLGLFKTKAKVKVQVSAENGEILRVKKPFLTSVKTAEVAE